MTQNWAYNTPVPQPGNAQTVGGGGGGLISGPRDALDAKRMGRVPSAEYPDGYLGTVNSRREDRVLNAVKQKINDRSYQRGVHKHERVDPSDYYWPGDFGPMSGLKAQAQGKRWTASGLPEERLAHGGKHAFTSPEELGRIAQKYGISAIDPAARAETDSEFAARMRGYLPAWR
ncbi:hypothetical protein GCM10010149_88760 [Nonomuraea roseoviolacea subsp. roseoviolacea]|uniref:hypothetical protein n=1 Tax=Nonomuraea roseoviolacea TaxID=103837 RepID=UPI0031D581FB